MRWGHNCPPARASPSHPSPGAHPAPHNRRRDAAWALLTSGALKGSKGMAINCAGRRSQHQVGAPSEPVPRQGGGGAAEGASVRRMQRQARAVPGACWRAAPPPPPPCSPAHLAACLQMHVHVSDVDPAIKKWVVGPPALPVDSPTWSCANCTGGKMKLACKPAAAGTTSVKAKCWSVNPGDGPSRVQPFQTVYEVSTSTSGCPGGPGGRGALPGWQAQQPARAGQPARGPGSASMLAMASPCHPPSPASAPPADLPKNRRPGQHLRHHAGLFRQRKRLLCGAGQRPRGEWRTVMLEGLLPWML